MASFSWETLAPHVNRRQPRSSHGHYTLAARTLDRADQVRVTPYDDRCIAAEIRRLQGESPPRVAVEAWTAELR